MYQTRIKRHLVVSILLLVSVEIVFMPHVSAAGIGLPSTITLYSQPPFGCAVSTYSVNLPSGSMLNIEMFSAQTVYLYLMTPDSFASWSMRHQCNSPGPNIFLYVTITRQLGYTLHWTPPSNGTVYFVFEYDEQVPLIVTVNLVDRSTIPSAAQSISTS